MPTHPAHPEHPTAKGGGAKAARSKFPRWSLTVLALGLLAMVGVSFAETAGPAFAGRGVNDASGGSAQWFRPENITADDSIFATTTVGDRAFFSRFLNADRFGLEIPFAATIEGITVVIDRRGGTSGGGRVEDATVQLIKGGIRLGENKAAIGENWPSANDGTPKTYGGPTDLWGLGELTPEDVNDPLFGVAMNVTSRGVSGTRQAAVDYVQVTVHYSVDLESPTVNMVYPANAQIIKTPSATIRGTATAVAGRAVDLVDLSIQRDRDGHYWTGSSWAGSRQWLRTDGKENWTYAWNFEPASQNAEETYTVTARVTDTGPGGPKLGATRSTGVRIQNTPQGPDFTPPALAVTSPFNGDLLNEASHLIRGTASDAAGVDSVGLTIKRLSDGRFWTGSVWSTSPTWLAAAGTTTWSYAWQFDPADQDGVDYEIVARATDAVANTGTSAAVRVVVDNVIPSNPSILINGGVTHTNNRNATLSLFATGATRMQFSTDGSSWGAWEPYATTRAWTLSAGDGTKTVYVRFGDTSGNLSPVAFDSIILDTVPPTGISILINGGAAYTANTRLTLTLGATGASQVQLRNEGGNWSAWRDFSTTQTWDVSAVNGVKTVYARFRDIAQNVSAEVSDSIILDTVAPAVTVNKAATQPDPTRDPSILFDIVFSEPVSGLIASHLRLEGTATGFAVTELSGSGANYTARVSANPLTAGEGTVILSLPAGRVRDQAGNFNLASTSTDNNVLFIRIGVGPNGSLLSGTDLTRVADGVEAATVQVQLRSQSGALITEPGIAVAFATDLGTLSTLDPVLTDSNGVARVTLTSTTAGTANVTAAIVNPNEGAVQNGAPVQVNFVPGPAVKLAFRVPPPASEIVEQPFSPAPVVVVQDAFGNRVTGSTAPITLALTAGTGTLNGVTTQNAVAGEASFPGLSINAVGTGKILTASSGGLTSAISDPFVITGIPVIVTPGAGQSKGWGEQDPLPFAYQLVPDIQVTGALGREAGEDAGIYAFTLGTLAPTNDRYELVLADGAPGFQITPKLVTVVPTDGQSKEFGASDPPFGFSLSDTSVAVEGALARMPGEALGTYAFLLGNLRAVSSNYQLVLASPAPTFEITRAVVTVAPTPNQRKAVGEPDPAFTFSLSNPQVAVVGALSREPGEAIGPYAFKLGSLEPVNDSYLLVLADPPGVFSITLDTIVVTPIPGQSKLRGEPDPEFRFFLSDASVLVTGALTRAPGEEVGAYPYALGTLASVDPRYFLVLADSADAFRINATEIEVIPDPGQKKDFGSADPTLTFSVSVPGLAVSGALARDAGEEVGEYEIRLGTLVSEDPEYRLVMSSAPVLFNVVPASVTVTPAAGQFKRFADVDPPAFAFSLSNPALGVTGSLSRETGENVGSYAFTLGNLRSLDFNYRLVLDPQAPSFSIRPLPVEVRPVAGQAKVFGSPDPDFFRFRLSDPTVPATGVMARASGENAGSYPFNLGSLRSLNPNYELVMAVPAAPFVIDPFPVTVRPTPNQSKFAGAPDPILTYSLSIQALPVTGLLGRSPGETPGFYDFNLGTLATVDQNYRLEMEFPPTTSFVILPGGARTSAAGSDMLAGDMNGDGVVDAADVLFVINETSSETADLRADLNQDGLVDQEDVERILELSLGKEPTSGLDPD